jgi:hypothetical protein
MVPQKEGTDKSQEKEQNQQKDVSEWSSEDEAGHDIRPPKNQLR